MINFIDYLPINKSTDWKTYSDSNDELFRWALLDTLSNQNPPIVVVPELSQNVEKKEPSVVTPTIPKVDQSTYVSTNMDNSQTSTVVTPKIEQAAQQISAFSDTSNIRLKPKSGEVKIKNNVVLSDKVKAMVDELVKAGFRGELTRGLELGAKTAQGNDSYHGVQDYHAIDVIPFADMSWDQFREHIVLTGADKIFKKYGYGILDETIPEMMKRTDASGPHFHIGRDRIAIGRLGGTFNPYK